MTSISNDITPSSQRNITISYDIILPNNSSSIILSEDLAQQRTIQIPVSDLDSLSKALDEARSETNNTLTRWKDQIGELEKAKEVANTKRVEESKRLKREQAAVNGEEEDDSDEDGDGEE